MISSILRPILSSGAAVLTLLPVLIFSGCQGNDWARRIDWPGIDSANIPGTETYPDAPAVILLDEGSIEVHTLSESAFSTYERHTIIKILNPRGYKYANIAVAYGSNSEVDEIKARTIGPDGRIHVLDTDKLFDVNLYPNFVFYSDQRAKIFTLPAVSEGCIIEYQYRIVINSRTYGSQWRFQGEIPVLKSRFTLIKRSDWQIDYRMHGAVSGPQVITLSADSRESMQWEAGPLPGIRPEVFMPPGSETGTRLTIAPFGVSSWSDIAGWYGRLSGPRIDQRGDLGALADSITADLKTDREKLKALFQWTRENIRYIAVEIGMGGYQPNPAEEVENNRYGDCKDMTTLLCALAAEADIPVYQTLISTRQNGLPDTTLPAATQFNHVIAFAPTVDEGGVWMDATDKSCPFGFLPWYDQDVPVLFIGNEGEGRIMHTPKSTPDDNRTDIGWNVRLNSDGSARVTTAETSSGIIANELRHQLRSQSRDDQLKWLEYLLEERSPGARIDTFSIQDLEHPENPLTIRYTFRDEDFGDHLSGMLLLEPGRIAGEKLHAFFQDETRFQPIRLQIPAKSDLQLTIWLPDGWRPVRERYSVKEDTPFGKHSLSWKTAGAQMTVDIEILTPAQEIVPSAYQDFIEYLNKLRRMLETKIVVTRID